MRKTLVCTLPIFIISLLFLIFIFPLPSKAQEVIVLPGYDEAIEWLESIDWWDEDLRAEQLKAPRTLLIAGSVRLALTIC